MQMSFVLRAHWSEYLMEAAGLGLFMLSATTVTTLVEYPGSLVHAAFPDPAVRRLLIGLAMGLTAVGIIYSPWGKRSGAHLNPAVTLTFFRLGKIAGSDAVCYVAAQTIGGVLGVLIGAGVTGMAIEHPRVNFAVTVPGPYGASIAFLAEFFISFCLMLTILTVSNRPTWNAWTGVVAGALVAVYIVVEAPLSGMSMNPARTFASALPAHLWAGFWIYMTAPALGMLLAAECYIRSNGLHRVLCAKLHHHNSHPCIFRCAFKP